jgi:hypothetical protein
LSGCSQSDPSQDGVPFESALPNELSLSNYCKYTSSLVLPRPIETTDPYLTHSEIIGHLRSVTPLEVDQSMLQGKQDEIGVVPEIKSLPDLSFVELHGFHAQTQKTSETL